MENATMKLATLTRDEYAAHLVEVGIKETCDDYRVEGGAILLGPAGEQLWQERNTEFRGMIRAMACFLIGVLGVSEIEILSPHHGHHRLLERVIDHSSNERHGWYSWFETAGCWEIVWGSRHRAVVDGSGFTIYRRGRAGADKPEAIEGCVEERKDPEENLRAAMSYVEGYLRAKTPEGLAGWKAFSGRGVRGSVLAGEG
jgi:hypothetical protein